MTRDAEERGFVEEENATLGTSLDLIGDLLVG